MKYGGNWKATIPSLPASRSGPIALQNIWNAISTTSFDGRVSWRLFRSSTGNISRNCFGNREISAGCCVISERFNIEDKSDGRSLRPELRVALRGQGIEG